MTPNTLTIAGEVYPITDSRMAVCTRRDGAREWRYLYLYAGSGDSQVGTSMCLDRFGLRPGTSAANLDSGNVRIRHGDILAEDTLTEGDDDWFEGCQWMVHRAGEDHLHLFSGLELHFERLPDGRFHVRLKADLWDVRGNPRNCVLATADFIVATLDGAESSGHASGPETYHDARGDGLVSGRKRLTRHAVAVRQAPRRVAYSSPAYPLRMSPRTMLLAPVAGLGVTQAWALSRTMLMTSGRPPTFVAMFSVAVFCLSWLLDAVHRRRGD